MGTMYSLARIVKLEPTRSMPLILVFYIGIYVRSKEEDSRDYSARTSHTSFVSNIVLFSLNLANGLSSSGPPWKDYRPLAPTVDTSKHV
jgi:hypothetical protein